MKSVNNYLNLFWENFTFKNTLHVFFIKFLKKNYVSNIFNILSK